jgi:thiosulfate/3-mercaptopyruvate sulfurtransferase
MFPVVSIDWLYNNLNNSQVVIADCRFSLADSYLGQKQYQTDHIPGAYYFDLNQDLSGIVAQRGGRHPLPEVDQLAQKLTAIGVTSETTVIAYDSSRFAFAARFWWLLRYMGHDRVAVLDGGLEAWQAAGYSTTAELPAPKAGGHFVPQVRQDWVVDRAAVKAQKELPGVVLVDAREGERYRGEREPIDPIAGHIPGAVNYPWQFITNDQGLLHPVATQQQHWQSLQTAEKIIVYCGSGVTACVNLLSLEIAGIQTGRLYAGSWSDWCSYL